MDAHVSHALTPLLAPGAPLPRPPLATIRHVIAEILQLASFSPLISTQRVDTAHLQARGKASAPEDKADSSSTLATAANSVLAGTRSDSGDTNHTGAGTASYESSSSGTCHGLGTRNVYVSDPIPAEGAGNLRVVGSEPEGAKQSA